MLLNIFIVFIALSIGGYLVFSNRIGKSNYWKAMATPLASIMGSGFLVSAPLLGATVGNLALIFMAVLLVLAYFVGGAIRFNIRYFEPIENTGKGAAQDIAFLSRAVLIGAYFISVTYYLQLLAAFALNALGSNDQTAAHLITSSLLIIIGGVGMWRGLGMLEKLEKYTVALNLGMIGALIVALIIYNLELFTGGQWKLPAVTSEIDFHGARVLLGLLIVVQGFETSRYLGDEHPAEVRISSMRSAQIVSGIIYLLFIGFVTVLFQPSMGADVTGVIELTMPVAVILPVLLSIAAIGSQFSASVADSEGAGGLIEDITHHKLKIRYAYLLIMLVTISITWGTDVNQIIAYASRAFALYYSLQCVVAFLVAWRCKQLAKQKLQLFSFAFLALVCFLVFALGVPSG